MLSTLRDGVYGVRDKRLMGIKNVNGKGNLLMKVVLEFANWP
jgi:hypothetical protein